MNEYGTSTTHVINLEQNLQSFNGNDPSSTKPSVFPAGVVVTSNEGEANSLIPN